MAVCAHPRAVEDYLMVVVYSRVFRHFIANTTRAKPMQCQPITINSTYRTSTIGTMDSGLNTTR